MASRGTKLGVIGLAAILALGIGYFIYLNATTGTKEIDITLDAPTGSAYLTPDNVTASLGQQVTIVVFNDDNNPHVFGIPGLNVTTITIPDSESGRVSFSADKVGTFWFYSPQTADDIQGETNVNGTITVTAG